MAVSKDTWGDILAGVGAGLTTTGTALSTGSTSSLGSALSSVAAPHIDVAGIAVGAVAGAGLAYAFGAPLAIGALGGGVAGAVVGPMLMPSVGL